MKTRAHRLQVFIVLTILISLIGLDVAISMITPEDVSEGFFYHLEQGLLILNIIIITWVILRFFHLFIWRSLERKHHVPKTLKDVTAILIIFLAIVYAGTSVFGVPVWSVVTAGGFLTAGIAWGLKDLIYDFFSGILIDLERHYSVGDWLLLQSEVAGPEAQTVQVVGQNWRTTTFVTPGEKLVVVPNRELTSRGFLNYSRPERPYRDAITVSLDHEIPVDRAERLLVAATLKVPEVANYNFCQCYSLEPSAGGVDYYVQYMVADVPNWRETRHDVIESISRHLHNYGLRFSEGLGAYKLSRDGPFEQEPSLSLDQVLPNLPLFSTLHKTEMNKLKKDIKRRYYKKGDTIVSEGDEGNSMFIIGEGSVDVLKKLSSGDDELLAFLGPGDYFGDMALLTGEKRTASVRAKTNLLAFEVEKKSLTPILKKRPIVMEKLSDIVAERKLRTQKALEARSLLDSKEKKQLSNKILQGIKEFFGL